MLNYNVDAARGRPDVCAQVVRMTFCLRASMNVVVSLVYSCVVTVACPHADRNAYAKPIQDLVVRKLYLLLHVAAVVSGFDQGRRGKQA